MTGGSLADLSLAPVDENHVKVSIILSLDAVEGVEEPVHGGSGDVAGHYNMAVAV